MEENTKQVKLTKEGYDALVLELKDLEEVQKPRNIQAIADARAQGDLSENADYAAAREEQGRIYSRISELEEKLKNCVIISSQKYRVLLNGRIEKEIEIVGTLEADPKNNKISDESPLGKAVKEGKSEYVTDSGAKVSVQILNKE